MAVLRRLPSRLGSCLVGALLASVAPGCALLYPFDETGAGGASSSAAETIASATAATSGTAGGDFVFEDCTLVAGAGDDQPGRPALVTGGSHLYYAGRYAGAPSYLGQALPPAASEGIAFGILSPETGQAFFSGFAPQTAGRTFVTRGANDDVLFGGSWLGDAHLDFSEQTQPSEGADGFVVALLPAATPGTRWNLGATLGALGGDGPQLASTAAWSSGSNRALVGGAAGKTFDLGAPTCPSVMHGGARFGFLRSFDVDSPEPVCRKQITWHLDGRDGLAVDDIAPFGTTSVLVSVQVDDTARPDGGHGILELRDASTLAPISANGAEVARSFSSDGTSRLRLASAGQVAHWCGTRFECTTTACGFPEAQRPDAIHAGTLELANGFVDTLSSTGATDADWIECGAIAVVGGDVVIGGSVSGRVDVTFGERTLTLESSGGEPDAFVLRYEPGGARFSGRVFGGSGADGVTTIANGFSATTFFVAGGTNGDLGALGCAPPAGGIDTYVLEMTLLEPSGAP